MKNLYSISILVFLIYYFGQINPMTSDSCLASKAETPCELLSQSDISSLLNVSSSSIKSEGPWEGANKSEHKQCTYTWNTGRKTQLKTQYVEMEVDQDNIVRFGSCLVVNEEVTEESPAAFFKNRYRKLTEAEKKSMQQMFDEKSEEEQFSGAQKNIGKSMLSMMSDIDYEYEDIGDRAVWKISPKLKESTLIVLKDDVIFQVSANISNEIEENRQAVRNIVNKIISNCN